jgi:hypothetical protein
VVGRTLHIQSREQGTSWGDFLEQEEIDSEGWIWFCQVGMMIQCGGMKGTFSSQSRARKIRSKASNDMLIVAMTMCSSFGMGSQCKYSHRINRKARRLILLCLEKPSSAF